MIEQVTPEIPWAALANASSAALVCGVWWYCVSAMAKQRKEFADERAAERKEFTSALTGITTQFGDRVQHIADNVVASNERVEEAVRDLAIEMRTGNTRAKGA